MMNARVMVVGLLLGGAVAMAEGPVVGEKGQNVTIVLPPIPAKSSAVVPPEMLEALKALSSEDFKSRQEAVSKLQLAMGKHFQQMVLVQDLMIRIQTNLAEQLKMMTGTEDAEANAKVASLMEFNVALSRWAIDAMALPEEKRKGVIEWGLKEENLPLVAKAYNRRAEVRGAAAKELAGVKDVEAVDWMLQRLMVDEDREVSLRTMDAVWERKITPEMVDVLWDRATAYAMNQIKPRQQKQRMVTVRGRTIQIYDQDQSYNRQQDADVAVDLLIKAKAPVITERLDGLFKDLGGTLNNNNDSRWRSLISTNYGGDAARAMVRLIEAYQPKEAIPFLMKALQGAAQDGYDTTVGNNEKVRYSSRIDAAAMLIKITGQEPEDYNLRKYSGWGDRWLLKGTVTEETELMKKVNEWWRKNAKEYGVEVPAEKKVEEGKGEVKEGALVVPGGAVQEQKGEAATRPVVAPRLRLRVPLAPATQPQ